LNINLAKLVRRYFNPTNKEQVMRIIGTAGLLILTVTAGASAQGVGPIETNNTIIDIAGMGYVKTYPCNGRDVVIAGSKHVITLTGVCKSLDISGVQNSVILTVAPNAKVAVAGSRHIVKWRSTAEPMFDISGVDNKVERVK
jgi:hypothetical protein